MPAHCGRYLFKKLYGFKIKTVTLFKGLGNPFFTRADALPTIKKQFHPALPQVLLLGYCNQTTGLFLLQDWTPSQPAAAEMLHSISGQVYEKPLVTVDIVVFTIHQDALNVLLLERPADPYQGFWSIPGGFIYEGETLEEAASRWLSEKTTVHNIYLEQLYAFGAPQRDPRSRVITVAYYALVSYEALTPEGRNNPGDGTAWFSVGALPELAFDHQSIVNTAINRLKERLETSPIAFQLLPAKFTLTELQRVYELILSKMLDKRNFRKKMLASGILQELGETKMEGYHRPAQLYRFQAAFQANLGTPLPPGEDPPAAGSFLSSWS